MQTENLTDQQRNDLLRKQLWIDVYVTYLKSENTNTRIYAEKAANVAVIRFDKMFSNSPHK
jgi:hypothetical protein